MMYREQVQNNWPGLAKEAEQLCEKLQVEEVNMTSKTKTVYTAEVKKACKLMEDIVMKTETTDMEKMRVIRAEELGIKGYVKNGRLWSVRKTWEALAFMLHVAGNYSHNNKYQATGWQCQAMCHPCQGGPGPPQCVPGLLRPAAGPGPG